VKRINLIPPDRRRRIAETRCAAAWLRFTIVYTTLLATGLVIVRAAAGPQGADTGAQLGDARTRAETIRTEASSLRAQITALTTDLRRASRVRQQPDWSALFALASSHLGDRVVLTRFALENREAGDHVLTIRGIARGQQAVTYYLLAMERSDVFSTVRLVEQRRAGSGELSDVDFSIECVVVEGGSP